MDNKNFPFDEKFYKANSFTKKWEGHGVLTNIADDLGGETYSGISRKMHPNLELWAIIDEIKKKPNYLAELKSSKVLQVSVEAFYFTEFWQSLRLNEVPTAIGIIVYDQAVNQGKVIASTNLQKCLNVINRKQQLFKDVEVDGDIGRQTLIALSMVKSNDDINLLAELLLSLRVSRYVDITLNREANEIFIKGWINRISDLRKYLLGVIA